MLFVASLLLVLVPWNISLWWLLRRLALAIEIDCDRRVVNALGNPNRYGELLIEVATMGVGGPRLQPGFIGGTGTLERRLKQLVAPSQLSRGLRYVLPVVALILLIVVLVTPHPVMSSH